jgi:hypothetical protein
MKKETITKATNQQFTIPIRKGVLTFIEEILKGENTIVYKNKKLKKELIIYLIFYIVDLTEEEGYGTHLNTKILKKKFLDDYKPYLSFLEDKGLIILARKGAAGGSSSFYGLDKIYYYFEKIMIKYEITDTFLLKKINPNDTGLSKYYNEKNLYCIETRKHLVKHFDDNLEIDVEGATKEIYSLDEAKYDANFHTIHEYDTKLWNYSIKKKTDNRLHTIISRTNKKLLKHITYKRQKLGEIDIKTSQPLFLFIALNSIFNTTVNSKLKTFLKNKLGEGLQKKLIENGIDKEELKEFGKIILEGDLYNYLITKIEIRKNSNNKYCYECFDGELGRNRTVEFENKRELMKTATLRAMYGGKGEIVNDIREMFPSIKIIINLINKEEGLSETKNNLSNILQNLEAYIVLDLIAKDISNRFKEIPLFSKHDSLITYNSSIEEVKAFMQTKFKDYTGIDGGSVLVCESW